MTRELHSRVWEAAGDRNPALQATVLEPLVIDLDATLVTSHSDKNKLSAPTRADMASPPSSPASNYGAGNGTGEILVALVRTGNAGADSAQDHITVFTQAIEQLPDDFYDGHGELIGEKVLVCTDSAGASRKFLHYCWYRRFRLLAGRSKGCPVR